MSSLPIFTSRHRFEINEIRGLFDYYLGILRNNAEVAEYIADPDNGFEKLNKLLQKDEIRFVFVYGTLMKDSGEEWQDKVEAQYRGRGEMRKAILYDLGKYPGAIPSESSDESVKGEVYELSHPQSAMKVLDEYEEYFPLKGRKSLFFRAAVPVSLDGRTRKHAWVYFYNGPTDKAHRIPTGDFRTKTSSPASPEKQT